ncbi:hypothetical protein [Kaistia terrae]|uniref:Uncharacterized protein n=1 Tax=Kaistia terrae TaxID=537017 RepID=A0ABW0PYM6_9HYPH|nr:hypothetical protein [Kaistia terrae]MCX5581655.1 hypothetical protein [Kaistia terrae]
MTDALARWLSEKNYRGIAINFIMLTAVLAVAESAGLFRAVGGAAIGITCIYFLFRAASLTVRSSSITNLYQIALIWIPGVLAICLALTGLYLVTSTEPMTLAYLLGVILFGCELVMLTIAAADLEGVVNAPITPVETA